MKKSNTVTSVIVTAMVIVTLIVTYFMMGVSVRNREASLRAQFNASVSANKVDYDAMWKIIGQTASVPGKYSKDFADAYTRMLSGGSGEDKGTVGKLFAVATGMKPPQFDSTLYRKIQDVIESERTKFANAQKMQLDIKREHDQLRTTWPGTWFVADAAPLESKIVTSTRTDKAFDDGKDDSVELFGK